MLSLRRKFNILLIQQLVIRGCGAAILKMGGY